MKWSEFYEAHRYEFEHLDEAGCAALEQEYDMYYSPEAEADEAEGEAILREIAEELEREEGAA